MALQRRTRRPNGTKHAPTRSIRIEDDVWEPARRRAALGGLTMSRVVHELVRKFGQGQINLMDEEVKK